MLTPILSVSTLNSTVKTDWRREYFEFLNEKIDQIEEENSIEKLRDITKAIFTNKSEILGKLASGLLKEKFSDLVEQEYHQCPDCAKSLKARGPVKKEVETMIGKIELLRPYFYCRDCQKGCYPMDEALELSDGVKQYDVQEVEAWLAAELPYETASKAFKICTGEKLSAHHMHEITNRIASESDLLDICPTKEEIENQIDKIAAGKFRRPVLMLAVDGAHAPTRPEPSPWKGKRGKGEYKEAKGFRFYLIDSDRIEHLISWHQVQTDKQLAQALERIKDAQLIPEDKVRLCVIGDGSAWIWNQVKLVFPSAKEILDYYHCSGHIYELAKLQYGEASLKALEWAEATLARLFYNQVDNVLHGLQRMQPASISAQAKIKSLKNYLSKHRHRVNYGCAKRGGYHIGSGGIESANKFIGHVRIKRSGAWWYPTNANHILKLRCAKYNGKFDCILNLYKHNHQCRIYNNAA